MKKFAFLSPLLLLAVIVAAASVGFAQKAQTPGQAQGVDVDGKVWMASSPQEKTAFLYGAASAVALEYHLRGTRHEEPTRFVRGWTEGLQNVTWSDMASRIDSYYRNHPDQMHRNVFDVIWKELITPQWRS